MKHRVVEQMQQDRIEGNVDRAEDALYKEYLATGAKNLVPDLPRSSYVKIISGPSAGEIHVWTEYFAKFPDMCVNCDVNGNTDPAAWRQVSVTLNTNITPTTTPPPKTLAFNFSGLDSGEVPGDVPQVQNASLVLGIDSNFTQDYTSPDLIKAALPLPRDSKNEVVSETVKVMFDSFI